MLEYGKFILQKVSFDNNLFMKELRKIKSWMRQEESRELDQWCRSRYSNLFLPSVKITK